MGFEFLKSKAKDLANKAKEHAETLGTAASDVFALSTEKVTEMSSKAVESVIQHASDFEQHFSESKFTDKLSSIAKKVGASVIYPALLLFELLKSDDVPAEKKMLIIGSLGYFILPVDFLPDAVLGMGFTDDIAVMTMGLRASLDYLTQDLSSSVKAQLHTWLGDFDEKSLDVVDEMIKRTDKTLTIFKK